MVYVGFINNLWFKNFQPVWFVFLSVTDSDYETTENHSPVSGVSLDLPIEGNFAPRVIVELKLVENNFSQRLT